MHKSKGWGRVSKGGYAEKCFKRLLSPKGGGDRMADMLRNEIL